MSRRPDESKLAKLPAWAREYIADIERDRKVAVRELNEYCDSQTPSGIYLEEYVSTGEQSGPSLKRSYVQSHKLTFEHAGIKLNVYINQNDRISLQWESCEHRYGDISMMPYSYQYVHLVTKENMR